MNKITLKTLLVICLFALVTHLNKANAQTWNISEAPFPASVGDITSQTTIGGLTMYATTSAKVTISTQSRSVDGFTFTHRLQTGGTGGWSSGVPTSRVFSFPVAGDTKITVYMANAGTGTNRFLVAGAGDNSAANEIGRHDALIGDPRKVEYTYTGNGTTVYLWSSNSGINIFYIKAEPIISPTITLSAASLAFYYQTNMGPSSGKTVGVTGEGLEGDITVTPPANFEISTNGITYQSTPITLSQNAGSYGPTNLNVRMKSGLVVGTYNGNLTFTSTNATAKTVALSGIVANALPPPDLRFNEIFAEPTQPTSPGLQGPLYSTIPGDANNDGLVHPLQDQFIEIYNNTSSTVNVTGYKLLVDGVVKHIFPFGSTIPANAVVVVFGGGSPTGFASGIAHVASSGSLDLSTTSGTVTFTTGSNVEIATYDYNFTSSGQSLTRDPEGTGTFVLHTMASTSDGAPYSPGAYNNGALYSPIPPVPFNWKWIAGLFLLMATVIVIRKIRFI